MRTNPNYVATVKYIQITKAKFSGRCNVVTMVVEADDAEFGTEFSISHFT